MHSIRGHSFSFGDAGQFLTEVDVGQLAAAVGEEGQQVVVEVLEVQLLVFVDGACEVDHPAGCTLLQARQKQIGQKEVTQVVDTKTHAEAVIRPVKDTGHACKSITEGEEKGPNNEVEKVGKKIWFLADIAFLHKTIYVVYNNLCFDQAWFNGLTTSLLLLTSFMCKN